MTGTEKFRAGAYTGIQSSLSKHWKDKNKSCQLSKCYLISESFSLLLKSQNKIATLQTWAFSLKLDSAQGLDLASFFGNLSQSEKLSEIKPPLGYLKGMFFLC